MWQYFCVFALSTVAGLCAEAVNLLELNEMEYARKCSSLSLLAKEIKQEHTQAQDKLHLEDCD